MAKGVNKVLSNLAAWGERKKIALNAVAHVIASDMERDAKQKARWQDQTGDARGGLKGGVEKGMGKMIIYIAHSVDYGPALELAHDGKYAILVETTNAYGPKAMSAFDKILKAKP